MDDMNAITGDKLRPEYWVKTLAGHDAISFDLFDTLIERPYDHPHILFDYMTPRARELTGNPALAFRQIREEARDLTQPQRPSEEVPLLQRYNALAKREGWSPDLAKKLCEEEEELELFFCRPTALGKELFSLAKQMNKKIAITTDTFLSQDRIEKILKKTGYEGYHYLFVSSEIGKLKWSGSLYSVMIEKLGLSPEKICHIGDHPVSDGFPRRAICFQNHRVWPLFIERVTRFFALSCAVISRTNGRRILPRRPIKA